jgi:pSer/pThr/pTyr-binding forkhead associated (FHA) protein
LATLQKIGHEVKCLLDQNQMRIGRASDNEIILEDETISGYHSLITIRPMHGNEKSNDYILEDLNSTNKTYVNNQEVSQHRLKEGDVIRIGNSRLKFSTKKYVAPQTHYNETKKSETKKIDRKNLQGFTFPN